MFTWLDLTLFIIWLECFVGRRLGIIREYPFRVEAIILKTLKRSFLATGVVVVSR